MSECVHLSKHIIPQFRRVILQWIPACAGMTSVLNLKFYGLRVRTINQYCNELLDELINQNNYKQT